MNVRAPRPTTRLLQRLSRALNRHLPQAIKGDDRGVHQARVTTHGNSAPRSAKISLRRYSILLIAQMIAGVSQGPQPSSRVDSIVGSSA